MLVGGGLVGPRPLRGVELFERGMDAVRCRSRQDELSHTGQYRKTYLGHSDSAREAASDRRLLRIASCGSALATVLAEDVLRELLVLALLAAWECR